MYYIYIYTHREREREGERERERDGRTHVFLGAVPALAVGPHRHGDGLRTTACSFQGQLSRGV